MYREFLVIMSLCFHYTRWLTCYYYYFVIMLISGSTNKLHIHFNLMVSPKKLQSSLQAKVEYVLQSALLPCVPSGDNDDDRFGLESVSSQKQAAIFARVVVLLPLPFHFSIKSNHPTNRLTRLGELSLRKNKKKKRFVFSRCLHRFRVFSVVAHACTHSTYLNVHFQFHYKTKLQACKV